MARVPHVRCVWGGGFGGGWGGGAAGNCGDDSTLNALSVPSLVGARHTFTVGSSTVRVRLPCHLSKTELSGGVAMGGFPDRQDFVHTFEGRVAACYDVHAVEVFVRLRRRIADSRRSVRGRRALFHAQPIDDGPDDGPAVAMPMRRWNGGFGRYDGKRPWCHWQEAPPPPPPPPPLDWRQGKRTMVVTSRFGDWKKFYSAADTVIGSNVQRAF